MGYVYKIDETYFDKIDTEYKAYILGLIYADGCIKQPKGNRQKQLSIVLQEEDKDILEQFSKDCAGGNFKSFHPPSIANKNWKKRIAVTITSDKLCNKLIDLGCLIRKSQVGMNFPNLDKNLIRHFIRGFFDGDGCITITKVKNSYIRKKDFVLKKPWADKSRLRIAFTSTSLSFLKRIEKELGLENCYVRQVKRTQIVYTLWIEKQEDVKKVTSLLYTDSSVFLSRKYQKVLEFNKIIKSQAEDTSSEGLETT